MFWLARKAKELSAADIELIREAAGALARCGERLENALRQLRSAQDVLESCGGSGSSSRRQAAVEQYKAARRQAETARYMYIVQREAVGFRNHKFADHIYPLPPPRNLPR
jgi:multidrug resistance efflux pump